MDSIGYKLNSRGSNEEININNNRQSTLKNDSRADYSDQSVQINVKKFSNSSIQQDQEQINKSGQYNVNDIREQQNEISQNNLKDMNLSNIQDKSERNCTEEVSKYIKHEQILEENIQNNEFNSMRKQDIQNKDSFHLQKITGSIQENEEKDLNNKSIQHYQGDQKEKQSIDQLENNSQPRYSEDISSKENEFKDQMDQQYKKQSIDSIAKQNIQTLIQTNEITENLDTKEQTKKYSHENSIENSQNFQPNNGIQQNNITQSQNSIQENKNFNEDQQNLKEQKQQKQFIQNNTAEQNQNQYKKYSQQLDQQLNQTNDQNLSQSRINQIKNDQLHQDNINYKKSLMEKDIMLDQIKQLTIQLQCDLDEKQNIVIDLKNENKNLISKLRDIIQPNQSQLKPDNLFENKSEELKNMNNQIIEEQIQKQNSLKNNQECELHSNNQQNQPQFQQKISYDNKQYDLLEESQIDNKSKDNLLQQNGSSLENQQENSINSQKQNEIHNGESDKKEIDLLMSTCEQYRSAPREEGKELKSHLEDKNNLFSEQDQTFDVTKTRINETKNSTNILRNDQTEEELSKQIDNLDQIIQQLRQDNSHLEEENQSLIKKSHHFSSETKDLQQLLNNEIEILSVQNRTQMQPTQYQRLGNQEYTTDINQLNYKLEVMQQKILKLTRSNCEQFEDMQTLLQENDLLIAKVETLTKQLEAKEQEYSNRYEQFKLGFIKEQQQQFNLQVQDIHYKSNFQIERYKQLLIDQQQQQNQFFNALNSQNQLIAPPNFSQNTQNNQLPFNNSQSNGYYMNNNVNMNNYQHNNNLFNGQSNMHSQKQLNNTQSLNSTNQNFYQQNQYPQLQNIQPTSRSNSELNSLEMKIVWEICGILRHQQIETLPKVIADISDLNQNLKKFSDCMIQLTLSCNPDGYFGDQQPNLVQCWKWIKQILEEYMHLKNQSSNNNFEQQIYSTLQVNNQVDAIDIIKDKLIQCTIASRSFKKVSNILNIKQFDTFAEFEQAIELFDKEDMEIPKKLE